MSDNIQTLPQMAVILEDLGYEFLKTLVPALKVIEACHTHQLENMIDIWVPQMNFLKSGMDFYTERQAKGHGVLGARVGRGLR